MKKYFNFFGRVWMRATSGSFSPAPTAPTYHPPPANRMNRGHPGAGPHPGAGHDLTPHPAIHVTSRFLDDPARWMTPSCCAPTGGAALFKHQLPSVYHQLSSKPHQTEQNDPHRRFQPRRLQSRILHIQLESQHRKIPSRHRRQMEPPFRVRRRNL